MNIKGKNGGYRTIVIRGKLQLLLELKWNVKDAYHKGKYGNNAY